jgi:cytochrome c-type biogenesis protein CcsB
MPIYDTILSRDSYLLFIELRVFWSVAFLYGLSLILYLFHILTRSSSVGRGAQFLLWLAALVHVGLIVLRTFEARRAPFQTPYESLSWFAFSAAITYLFMSRNFRKIYLPGTLVSGLSLGACMYALLSRSPAVEPLSAALQSYWFEWHVVLAFFSYAVFVVSAAIEMSFMAASFLLKRGFSNVYGFNGGIIDEFHGKALKLVLFGFPLLTFAIFSRAVWANEAWGRYWSWDPKETWPLITWTVFAIYLHSKTVPGLKGVPASLFNVLGFVCVMMTFLGVNWLAKLFGIPNLQVFAV